MDFGRGFLAMTECFEFYVEINQRKLVSSWRSNSCRATKDRERPVGPALNCFMMFVCVCLWCPIHCSLVHGHICVCVHEYAGPHILLVLRNLTSLHWTLAVYTGNCSPCPNLPLPARLSHHRTSSAAGAFSIVSLMIALALCSIDIANKLSRMTKVNFYKVKSTKQLVIVGPNVYHSSLVFSQNKVIIRINLIQACW